MKPVWPEQSEREGKEMELERQTAAGSCGALQALGRSLLSPEIQRAAAVSSREGCRRADTGEWGLRGDQPQGRDARRRAPSGWPAAPPPRPAHRAAPARRGGRRSTPGSRQGTRSSALASWPRRRRRRGRRVRRGRGVPAPRPPAFKPRP